MRKYVFLLLVLASSAGARTTVSSEMMLRWNLIQALLADQRVEKFISSLQAENFAEGCVLNAAEESVSDETFTADYKCAKSYAYGIKLYGTYTVRGERLVLRIDGATVQNVYSRPGELRGAGPCVEGDPRVECVYGE